MAMTKYSIDSVEIIKHYFPLLTPKQVMRFGQLQLLYNHWNTKVNLISRKDIAYLYQHHVLHCLAIAKLVSFCDHTKVLDAGTGGGFPGVPLAIMFPRVHFHLVDSIQKKITALQEIVVALGLDNVTVSCIRVEKLQDQYDFIVGRAVTDLALWYNWIKHNISNRHINTLANGILYLKGDDFTPLPLSVDRYVIQMFFKEPFFNKKYIIHGYVTNAC